MKTAHRSNALLVELLIVILFFMLASTVLLRVFAAARNQSARAEMLGLALNAGQNAADTLYAAPDPEEALRGMGFVPADDRWVLEAADWQLSATVTREDAPGGVWLRQTVSAWDKQGEALFTLPCSRYAEEAAP